MKWINAQMNPVTVYTRKCFLLLMEVIKFIPLKLRAQLRFKFFQEEFFKRHFRQKWLSVRSTLTLTRRQLTQIFHIWLPDSGSFISFLFLHSAWNRLQNYVFGQFCVDHPLKGVVVADFPVFRCGFWLN